jgi:hypothetical protein
LRKRIAPCSRMGSGRAKARGERSAEGGGERKAKPRRVFDAHREERRGVRRVALPQGSPRACAFPPAIAWGSDTTENMDLSGLVMYAYDIKRFQISGPIRPAGVYLFHGPC